MAAAAAALGETESEFTREAIRQRLVSDGLMDRIYSIPKLEKLRDQLHELYGPSAVVEVTLPTPGHPLDQLEVRANGRDVPAGIATGTATLTRVNGEPSYLVMIRHPEGPHALVGIVPTANNVFRVAVEAAALPRLLTDGDIHS